MLYNPLYAAAEEWLDHSAYTITTYSIDSLATDNNGSSFNEKSLLLITGFHSDISNGEHLPSTDTNSFDKTTESSRSFIIAGKFDATSRLAITGALGITQKQWDSNFFDAEEESWEANLGLIYKLFDNLSYGVHFGYKDTGDTSQKRSYDSTESIMMISNQISLSF